MCLFSRGPFWPDCVGAEKYALGRRGRAGGGSGGGAARAARILRDGEPMLRAGVLRRDGGRLFVPAERFLLSDAAIGALFEPEPDRQESEGEKR